MKSLCQAVQAPVRVDPTPRSRLSCVCQRIVTFARYEHTASDYRVVPRPQSEGAPHEKDYREHRRHVVPCLPRTCGSPPKRTPEWGSGVAPFAFALTGDMPYGTIRETPFARLVAEINGDNAVDFVMHAGDIKAGNERCDDTLIRHRFDLYQAFHSPFVYTPGDNEWTDCHRVNNGQYNPLERLDFLRSFRECRRTVKGWFTG